MTDYELVCKKIEQFIHDNGYDVGSPSEGVWCVYQSEGGEKIKIATDYAMALIYAIRRIELDELLVE